MPNKTIKKSSIKLTERGENSNTALLLKLINTEIIKVVTPVIKLCLRCFFIYTLSHTICNDKVNDSRLSKDCGLGLAGFPKDPPARHRSWRFPLSDLFAMSPVARLDYHLVHTVILNPPSRKRNSLGVFLDTNLLISSLFCSTGFKLWIPWPLVPMLTTAIPPIPLKAGYSIPSTRFV